MWTSTTAAMEPPGPWLRSRRWDLTFIIGSGVLVAVPLLTYYGVALATGEKPQIFQAEQTLNIAMFINLAVAGLIGGPHMYATYTMTLAERRFRQRFPVAFWAAPLIPTAVITLAIVKVELLMTAFFFWASIHVLHQLTFIVQQYQRRAHSVGQALPRWSRYVDYGLGLSCLYPIAMWRLLAPAGSTLALPGGLEVGAGFYIGRVDLAAQLPSFVQGQVWIAWLFWAAFGTLAAVFVARTVWEVATGRVVWPRTLILLATVPIAFAIPMFDNMDVAFQGFNLWHSLQYLGLVYLMNAYRKERGEISSPFVARFSGFGNGLRYYGFVVGVAILGGALIAGLHWGAGLPLLQVYYAVVLSVLLVHYLWDHVLFATQHDALTPTGVAVAPSAGRRAA